VDALAHSEVALSATVTTTESHAATQASVSAADDLYTRHAPLLRYIAVRKFCVPREDADALVHDVFATYLASPVTVRSPRPYLIGAICNAARHYWRERKNEEAALARVDVALPPDDEMIVDALGRKLLIASTLSRIGSKCRDLLRRYYVEGETTAAIAMSRETTSDYVLFLLHRCRKSARAIVRTLLT
jgi:RNA polymerase sigma factor (sigma-70 family)